MLHSYMYIEVFSLNPIPITLYRVESARCSLGVTKQKELYLTLDKIWGLTTFLLFFYNSTLSGYKLCIFWSVFMPKSLCFNKDQYHVMIKMCFSLVYWENECDKDYCFLKLLHYWKIFTLRAKRFCSVRRQKKGCLDKLCKLTFTAVEKKIHEILIKIFFSARLQRLCRDKECWRNKSCKHNQSLHEANIYSA